jgi:hypothetical protein
MPIQVSVTWRGHWPSPSAVKWGYSWPTLPPPRSYPAEKQDPAPRTIETFTDGSVSAACRALMRSPRSRWLRALRFSGRFSVMRRTPGAGSSISTSDSVTGAP